MTAAPRAKADALRDEWNSCCGSLQAHHEREDQGIFPMLRGQHASLGPVIDGLIAEHQRIDPLIARAERVFAELPATGSARAVVEELAVLLEPHLAAEETHLVQYLREVKQFPPPPNGAELDLYAQGFAWSSHGVAPDVLDQVYAMLPVAVAARLSAARAACRARI